ncbi:MAG: respiratory nitrate reductase subunit gamma [Acidobacteria bacterium]|nr:respiratory nitrate reductase subunit gamma [Acidobacteriota bacterium]
MIDSLLFVALPYVAVALCVVASVFRYRSDRYSYSAMSSQFLEHRGLQWGSAPWHVGIILILAGHIAIFLFPRLSASLLSVRPVLLVIEGAGIAFSVLCVAGLLVLITRRLTSARVQAVTSTMDLIVLAVLLVQVVLGIAVAVHYRWGAAWGASTLAPYLRSLVRLQPDSSFVTDMPMLVKVHIVGAWVFIALIPFSRLVHIFSIPLSYLARAPQLVIWSNLRRAERALAMKVAHSRRLFVRGAAATVSGGVLLGAGVLDKLARFFHGPALSDSQQAEVMESRLERIKSTVEQRELELERLKSDYIRIGTLEELDSKKGRYFTDYEMRPALAFRGDDGMPLLISAKCTHLGCTVASDVSDDGKILCPCHISWFDVRTGAPDPGSPARAPLPHLDWVLMNSEGAIVARRMPDGGTAKEEADLAGTSVYIAKRRGEVA